MDDATSAQASAHAAPSDAPAPVSAEEQMLRDALGDDLTGELRVLSREPYGSGALTGFEEAPAAGAGADAPTRYWYVDTSGKRVDAEISRGPFQLT